MNNIYPDITLSKGCVLLSQADKLFTPLKPMYNTFDGGYGTVIRSNNRKINKLLRKIASSKKDACIVIFFARDSSSGDIWYRNEPYTIIPGNGILGTTEIPGNRVQEYINDRKRKERELIDELESSQRGQKIY